MEDPEYDNVIIDAQRTHTDPFSLEMGSDDDTFPAPQPEELDDQIRHEFQLGDENHDSAALNLTKPGSNKSKTHKKTAEKLRNGLMNFEGKIDDLSWSDISKIQFPAPSSLFNNLTQFQTQENPTLEKTENPDSKLKSGEKTHPKEGFTIALTPSPHKQGQILGGEAHSSKNSKNSKQSENEPKYPLKFSPDSVDNKTLETFEEYMSSNILDSTKTLNTIKQSLNELMTDSLLHTLQLDEASSQFVVDRIVEVSKKFFEDKLHQENHVFKNRYEVIKNELGRMDELVKELARANDKLIEDLSVKDKEYGLLEKSHIEAVSELKSVKELLRVNGENTNSEVSQLRLILGVLL